MSDALHAAEYEKKVWKTLQLTTSVCFRAILVPVKIRRGGNDMQEVIKVEQLTKSYGAFRAVDGLSNWGRQPASGHALMGRRAASVISS